MPYLTGNTLAGVTCYKIRVPGDLDFRAAVYGTLLELTNPANWEAFGTVTPEEAAEAASFMFDEFSESDCMIGSIFAYATTELPPNCLSCDGSQHNRVDYPLLYDAILIGLQVDADHFVTPDLRGSFVWGRFDPNAPLVTGGEIFVTLTEAEMPAHAHLDAGHLHTVHDHLTLLALGPGEVPVSVPNILPGITGSASANIQSAGGGQGHNNIPPFVLLNYAIVAR